MAGLGANDSMTSGTQMQLTGTNSNMIMQPAMEGQNPYDGQSNYGGQQPGAMIEQPGMMYQNLNR